VCDVSHFLFPDTFVCVSLLQLHAICVGITSGMALLVYQWIIAPSLYCNQRTTSRTAWMVAFGLVIPLALTIPYLLIVGLDLQNKFLAQCCSAVPTIVVFRTLEALYGTAACKPATRQNTTSKAAASAAVVSSGTITLHNRDLSTELAPSTSSSSSSLTGTTTSKTTTATTTDIVVAPMEASLSNYIHYYSSLTYCQWCDKTQSRVPVTRREILQHLTSFLLAFTMASILFSWLLLYDDYQPFSTKVRLEEWHWNLWDLLHWHHLVNMYILGGFSTVVLSTLFQMNALRDNILQGYATCPVFGNPMLESSSPSEFWSKKWNLTLQKLLKV
jgi:hypothetical protein